ncbi:MAG TPA: hypothetical protein PKE58_12770, partial [Acidobacteriota bacterium]|nr:hypothetical protein [Acidobacteriota bacterium]
MRRWLSIDLKEALFEIVRQVAGLSLQIEYSGIRRRPVKSAKWVSASVVDKYFLGAPVFCRHQSVAVQAVAGRLPALPEGNLFLKTYI